MLSVCARETRSLEHEGVESKPWWRLAGRIDELSTRLNANVLLNRNTVGQHLPGLVTSRCDQQRLHGSSARGGAAALLRTARAEIILIPKPKSRDFILVHAISTCR